MPGPGRPPVIGRRGRGENPPPCYLQGRVVYSLNRPTVPESPIHRSFVLTAYAAPPYAGMQHVAEILGRKGASFRRRQLGSPSGEHGEFVRVRVSPLGLFELRWVLEDGEVWDRYNLVLVDPDGDPQLVGMDFEEARRLAKLLERGHRIDDVVWCGVNNFAFTADEPKPAPLDITPENLFRFKC
jgi:hypothetical protein